MEATRENADFAGKTPGAEAGGRSLFAKIATAQGLIWAVSGVWPVVSMRSFLAVTGPKQDLWLVKTVGLLVSVAGAALLDAGLADRRSRDLRRIAAGSAAVLAAIDVVYVAKGRIPRVYLLDAAMELGFDAAWLAEARREASGRA